MKTLFKKKVKNTQKVLLALLVFSLFGACKDKGVVSPVSMIPFGEIQATLTAPPHVPPTVGNRSPATVHVDMEVIEKEMEMTDGTSYIYWTFGGTVPGEFIRIRIGDKVKFTLKNHPDNKLPHNIDLHAVTGPGGGAESSFVAPGHQITFSFKALKPGLFIYHCAAPPVGMHIANGMYGLILVEPAGGLPPVDKEYYIMQGEFYTSGETGAKGLQNFNMEKALKEEPDYVVFNGSMDALTGANAIHAKVGETVRLYVGNGGPNLVSSFHVIGEIMDKVYINGGTTIAENIQTTLIPAGGAAIVEFKVDVPGELVLVDHSIFRAFNKGALGIMEVEGKNNSEIYSGVIDERQYLPKGQLDKMSNASKNIPVAIKTEKNTEKNIDNNLIKIKLTANDMMQFSTKKIVVEAGKTIQLTLAHTGKMPKNVMGHNFVLLKPGTDLNTFSKAAMVAPDNNYVPKNSKQVIAYTELIGGGEETTIEFEAPAPGTYTFICSFPGHYAVMKGTFIVK